MKNKQIIRGLAILISILFFPKYSEAQSLGNCDPSRMSSSEYNQCVQDETCGSNEHLDSSMNCVPNATSMSSEMSDNNPCSGASDGTSCYVGGGSGTCGGGYCVSYDVGSGGNSGGARQGSGAASNSNGNGEGWNPGSLDRFGLPSGSIFGIVNNLLLWMLSIVGILAVIGFVISGMMYIMSSGDEDMMKKAKQAMIYSIIGVIVALSGLIVISAVNGALNANFIF